MKITNILGGLEHPAVLTPMLFVFCLSFGEPFLGSCASSLLESHANLLCQLKATIVKHDSEHTNSNVNTCSSQLQHMPYIVYKRPKLVSHWSQGGA